MSHGIAAADEASILGELDEQGYCVIPGVLDADEIASVHDAIERAAHEDDRSGEASLYGPGDVNRRIWALLNRGEEFIRLGTHPLALSILRARMGADILLTNLTANITAPGGDREIGRMHTDQSFLPEPMPYLLAMNVTWFIDDFTEENGATLIVPGSHKVATFPPFDLAPSAPAQLTGPAGSMAVLDGRVHHATGLNRTRDRKRRGVIATYSPPFIRSQENWCRSLDPDVLERHPELAALTSFEVWHTLGLVKGPEVAYNA
jgi:ectoine hydroxylase-related dioxygenase (phytanoyl-CoA dioxygenase family)